MKRLRGVASRPDSRPIPHGSHEGTWERMKHNIKRDIKVAQRTFKSYRKEYPANVFIDYYVMFLAAVGTIFTFSIPAYLIYFGLSFLYFPVSQNYLQGMNCVNAGFSIYIYFKFLSVMSKNFTKHLKKAV